MCAFIDLFTATATARAARAGRVPFITMLVALAGATLASGAEARVGDVDPSYGVHGRFVPSSYGGTVVIAVLNDGSVIYQVDGGYSRADANGIPDPSFGSGGVQPWPAEYRPGISWQRTGQGKWLAVLSRAGTGGTEFAILKLGTDGMPDPTFGTNGVASVDIAPDGSRDPILEVQPDGKPVILIARHAVDNFYILDRLVLVRLLQDGTLDAAFGALGSVSVPTDPIDWMDGTDLHFLSNGLFVVRTYPVSCFDSSGAATACPPSAVSDLVFNVGGLLPDGGWIAWRRSGDGGHTLVKLLADGSPDLSFQYPPPNNPGDATGEVTLGAVGLLYYNPGGPFFASADGQYIHFWTAFNTRIDLHRYFAGGANSGPDGSFGAGGAENFGLVSTTGRPLGLADGSTMVATGNYAFRLLGQDAPSPGVLGVVSPQTFNAKAGAATLHVYRGAGSDGEVRVRYWTSGTNELPADGDYATPGADFDAVSGELDWADGDTSDRTINIPLHNQGPAKGFKYIMVRFEVLNASTWIASDTTRVTVDYTSPPASGGHGGGGGAMDWLSLLLAFVAVNLGRGMARRRGLTART